MFDKKAKKIEKSGSFYLPPDFLQQLDERLTNVDAYSENEKCENSHSIEFDFCKQFVYVSN
eukprot:5341667-Ditylum_brightwellii.AAC.1